MCTLKNKKSKPRNAMTFGKLALVLGITATMLGYSDTGLAEWQINPVVRAAWDYDDNASLSAFTVDETTLSGVIGEVSVDFRNNTENGFFSLRPMFRSRFYGDASDRDSDDQFLDLRYAYGGVRNDFRFNARYGRESVRTAEIADAALETDIDPDDISDDESARITFRERRERYRVTPRWTYRMSDVSSFDTSIDYLNVAYEERELTSPLFDFSDIRGKLSYRRSFSPRTSGAISLTARDYTTERVNGDRTGYGATLGVGTYISETTELRATVGVEATTLEDDLDPATDDSVQNSIYDISLVRNLETVGLLAQYRKRISPSGRGFLVARDEFNLRFNRKLNDRFSAGLGARVYSTSSVTGDISEQDYVQLRGQLIWFITESISMQTDYHYTVLNREVVGEGANSNRVTVWFSYHPGSDGRIR